ncbi:LolA family protein [Limnohabitans radicicola]|nr:outer membrane lipoprotein carrier protein LolA [Limnohabitans radicicola]
MLASRRGLMALLLTLLCSPWVAHAQGLELLSLFMKQASSGRATFTQVVTSPSKAGQPPRQKTSSGALEFHRPGQFRFVYKKPFAQTLLADGQNFWLHDVELNQITVRKQNQVLGSTPMALLTSAADVKALEADFQLRSEPGRDGLEWVRATPKAQDGQIQSLLAGLRKTDKGVELVTIDVQDSLGQRSVLTLSGLELNPTLPADTFVFRVPAGVEVIRP